jgi:hypothetical protein
VGGARERRMRSGCGRREMRRDAKGERREVEQEE